MCRSFLQYIQSWGYLFYHAKILKNFFVHHVEYDTSPTSVRKRFLFSTLLMAWYRQKRLWRKIYNAILSSFFSLLLLFLYEKPFLKHNRHRIPTSITLKKPKTPLEYKFSPPTLQWSVFETTFVGTVFGLKEIFNIMHIRYFKKKFLSYVVSSLGYKRI